MARTKAQKKEIVEKLDSIIDGAQSLVFVNIHGLKVADATGMRRKLKADNVGMFVAKKSLMSLALAKKKFTGTMPELSGEIAIAYGVDPVAPARGVYEFQKKLKDQISIVGGVFENAFADKAYMMTIASIPSTDVLRGMFVNVISSPMRGLVIALDAIAQKKS